MPSTAATPTTVPTQPSGGAGASTGPAAPGGTNAALAALAGPWRSTSNRDYLAVLTNADTLEFRIQQASQHPRQGYENGDVRFELKASANNDDSFAVEDHIRPTPPAGSDYETPSPASCEGTWTQVKGRKLAAKVDAKGALVVELVQIRTGLDKFRIEAHRVVACRDLAAAPAELIESKLSRVR
jgi:hypothetical protein